MNISSADRRDLRDPSNYSTDADSSRLPHVFTVALVLWVSGHLCLRRNVWAADWSWRAASQGSGAVQTLTVMLNLPDCQCSAMLMQMGLTADV